MIKFSILKPTLSTSLSTSSQNPFFQDVSARFKRACQLVFRGRVSLFFEDVSATRPYRRGFWDFLRIAFHRRVSAEDWGSYGGTCRGFCFILHQVIFVGACR
mgnify:CR=1 FL=1